MSPIVLLSEDQLQNLCRRGQGKATCSFLITGPDGFGCGKGSPFEGALRAKVLNGQLKAKGDNCSGPPDFKSAS